MKHVICGLISALLGIWGLIVWWYEFGVVMRGLIPFAMIGCGVIAIIAGIQAQEAADAGNDELESEEE